MTTKRRDSLDDASRAMIYDGLNLSELGRLFHMDHRVLVEKLHGVTPSGKRGKADTYQVHEVAPYLVKPIFDIESYVKRMNHADLPKMLTKEFWAGQRSKQEYLLKAGDLWPTTEVIKSVGELMKLMKMSVQLMSDGVERQVELTERQRTLIKSMCDGLLTDLRQAVIENFSAGVSEQEGTGFGEEEDDDAL